MSDPAQQPQYPPQYPQNPGQQMPGQQLPPNAPPQQPYPGLAGQPGQPGVPPQPKPKSKRRFIGLGIVLVVLVVVVVGALIANRHAANTAKAGDCVQQTGANDLKVVKCDDPKATFKVVGRVEDKTQAEASVGACDAYKDAQSSYWEGKPGKKGLVLCLAPVK
jgi:hypothetical protein